MLCLVSPEGRVRPADLSVPADARALRTPLALGQPHAPLPLPCRAAILDSAAATAAAALDPAQLRVCSGVRATLLAGSDAALETAATTMALPHGPLLAAGTVRDIPPLILRHPWPVRVDSPRIRDLAAQAAGWEEVVTVHLDDRRRRLTAEVIRADRFLGRLGDLALDGFPIEAIDTPDESLEAIFRYLVLERGAGGEEAEG